LRISGVAASVRIRMYDTALRNPSSHDGGESIPADLRTFTAENYTFRQNRRLAG
jgi:hypothetical protein